MEHPGEVIRHIRKEKNVSIEELADRTRIDKGTISRFERGGDYKMRVFKGICKALGITVQEIYAELSGKAGMVGESGYAYSESEQAELHKMLDIILNSKEDDLVSGITAILNTLSKSAIEDAGTVGDGMVKKRPTPDSGLFFTSTGKRIRRGGR